VTSPLSRGDVVLTRWPFIDLTGDALRPAVVGSQGHIGQDVVLIAISSVVCGALAPTDDTVESPHPAFVLTGLRVTSVLRMHKLAAVEQSVLVRRLGRLGPQLQGEVDSMLRVVLGL
jgi:mRNA interferase MazF